MAAHTPRTSPARAHGLLALCAVVLVGALATPANGSAPPVACRSGKAVFTTGAVRVFFLVHHLRSQPSLKWRSYYACRPDARRPRLIYESSPATYTHVYGFRIFGERLGFVVTSEGFAGGGEALVAWLDLRVGQLRVGVINVNEEQYTSPSAPKVPIGRVRFAIAPGGAVAVLGEDGPEQEIALLRLGTWKLRPPLRLLYTQSGTVEPGSLAISETAVTWRTRAGQEESAPA